jgi:hypothetical protein
MRRNINIIRDKIRKYGKIIPVIKMNNGPPTLIESWIYFVSPSSAARKNRGKDTTAGIKHI